MIVSVRVTPRAKKQEVITIGDRILKVKLVSPPIEDKANKELINVLADFYKVKKSSVHIVKGFHSRNKTVEIIADQLT
jgi:uncharacterized protein (TIGR00251 family)